MHRYVLGGFDQFNLVLNHAVIDCARSDEFSLNRIKRERVLQPHQLTVYQGANGFDSYLNSQFILNKYE